MREKHGWNGNAVAACDIECVFVWLCVVLVLQTGLYEMKEMVQLTGGQCVQIDSFTNVVFKDSLKRMFAK
jgi:hypothetical protein